MMWKRPANAEEGGEEVDKGGGEHEGRQLGLMVSEEMVTG